MIGGALSFFINSVILVVFIVTLKQIQTEAGADEAEVVTVTLVQESEGEIPVLISPFGALPQQKNAEAAPTVHSTVMPPSMPDRILHTQLEDTPVVDDTSESLGPVSEQRMMLTSLEPPSAKPKPPPRPVVPSVKTPTRSSTAGHVEDAVSIDSPHDKKAKQNLFSYVSAQCKKYHIYPEEASRKAIETIIDVDISVDSKGNLLSLQPKRSSKTPPVLMRAADVLLSKVRQNWRPQRVPKALSITFTLEYTLSKVR